MSQQQYGLVLHSRFRPQLYDPLDGRYVEIWRRYTDMEII
jgi:hypothetical protein